jgi:hypothetical protein
MQHRHESAAIPAPPGLTQTDRLGFTKRPQDGGCCISLKASTRTQACGHYCFSSTCVHWFRAGRDASYHHDFAAIKMGLLQLLIDFTDYGVLVSGAFCSFARRKVCLRHPVATLFAIAATLAGKPF